MLGVIVGALGRRSETYIARHIEGISPGRTEVCALSALDNPQWTPECPVNHLYLTHGPIAWILRRALGRLESGSGLTAFDRARLAHWLTSRGVRVVLCEYLPIALAVEETCRRVGVPVVAHAHGYDISAVPRKWDWAAEYFARLPRLDDIVVVSSAMRTRVLAFGVPEERVHVVPCGTDVDTSGVQGGAKAIEPYRLVAVGRLIAKKGPILLLESFRRVLNSGVNAELVVIGDGPLREAMSQCVLAMSLSGRVQLLGELPNGDVRRVLADSHVFLQHSVTAEDGDEEGLPVSILEAMSEGLPVVTTRHAGIPEAVIDQETGFLVSPGDCEAMASRTVELLRHYRLRIQMGEKGRQVALRRFSISAEMEGLRGVLGRHWPELATA